MLYCVSLLHADFNPFSKQQRKSSAFRLSITIQSYTRQSRHNLRIHSNVWFCNFSHFARSKIDVFYRFTCFPFIFDFLFKFHFYCLKLRIFTHLIKFNGSRFWFTKLPIENWTLTSTINPCICICNGFET